MAWSRDLIITFGGIGLDRSSGIANHILVEDCTMYDHRNSCGENWAAFWLLPEAPTRAGLVRILEADAG